jgi:UDP-GlcNAc:undecaprenyl-phosphate/decaprenyl-phosphate GlcNAc-1-phosphate transferase
MNVLDVIMGVVGTMGVGLLCIPIAFWISKKFDIVDKPDQKRKLHGKITPYLGGLVVCGGMTFGFFYVEVFQEYMWSLIGLYLLLVVGLVDDIRGVRASIKLAIQFIAIQFVCYDVLIAREFSSTLSAILVWAGYTVVGVGAINALNLIDGLDGLAIRICISLLAVVVYLAGVEGNNTVLEASIYAIAACIPFLIINTHPAKMFMGDAGSLWIGGVLFWLYALVQPSGNESTAAFVGWFPLLLSIPVIDVAMVMIRRIMNGYSIMRADRNHIHHRLQQFLGHCNTVEYIGVVSALWSLALIVLVNWYSIVVASVIGLLFYTVGYGVLIFLEHKKHQELLQKIHFQERNQVHNISAQWKSAILSNKRRNTVHIKKGSI